MKTCTTCLVEKPTAEFYSEGRDSRCKKCRSLAAKLKYSQNPQHRERMREKQRIRYLGSLDESRESARHQYYANREKNLALHKERRQSDKARLAASSAKYVANAQRETLSAATRRGEPWEPWEDALVLNRTESLKDTALTLGRTHTALRQRRRDLVNRFLEAS